jgi:hypothetical protein
VENPEDGPPKNAKGDARKPGGKGKGAEAAPPPAPEGDEGDIG